MIGISYGNALLTAGQRKYQTANSNRKYSGKGGFGTKVPNEERYIKTVSRGNFETCAEVDKIPCKYALKDEKAIGWHWKAPGIEYRFFHAVESTEENPVLVARGVDEHGKLFEEKIAVKQIDPYNTTPLEIDALSYFRPGEHYSISTYNLYGKEPGINERFDYVARTQERLASCNRLHLSEEAAWNKKDLDFVLGFTENHTGADQIGTCFKLDSDILKGFTEENKRNLELYSSAVRERMISGMARKCSEELFEMHLEQELFSRSRNHPLENKIEEKGEAAPSAEEDDYESISKTFLEILGIKLDKKINWNADGTSELTEDQIQYLREKYDVENMSKSDFYNLLAELSDMNVISHKDVENQFLRYVDPATEVIIAANEYSSQWMNSGNNYLSRFQNEERMYDYFIQALLDGKSSIQASDIFRARSYYEEQKESSGRLARVFEKLKSV